METFLSLLLFQLLEFSTAQPLPTLQFVELWFRHGERIPTNYVYFPNESPSIPYTEAEPGELTNRGVQQAYQRGKLLRKRYGDFLTDVYRPSQIHVWTGNDNRTIATAQAVLAAIFKPDRNHRWSTELDWQPVAVHTDPTIDWVSTGIDGVCLNYEKTFHASKEYLNVMEPFHADLISFLENNTGVSIKTPLDFNHVIDSLTSKVTIRKPSYTHSVFSELRHGRVVRGVGSAGLMPAMDVQFIQYRTKPRQTDETAKLFMNDTRLPFPSWAEPLRNNLSMIRTVFHTRMADAQSDTAGRYHSELLLSFIEDHLNRSPSQRSKAVFLAGHDTNFLALGRQLNIGELRDKMVPYAAVLAVELHAINGTHFVELYHSSTLEDDMTRIYTPLCDHPCSLQTLQRALKDGRLTRVDWELQCRGLGPLATDSGILTASAILLVGLFILSTVVLACTTFSYRKQLKEFQDPERRRLLGDT